VQLLFYWIRDEEAIPSGVDPAAEYAPVAEEMIRIAPHDTTAYTNMTGRKKGHLAHLDQIGLTLLYADCALSYSSFKISRWSASYEKVSVGYSISTVN
jgi:hypothetical protein